MSGKDYIICFIQYYPRMTKMNPNVLDFCCTECIIWKKGNDLKIQGFIGTERQIDMW